MAKAKVKLTAIDKKFIDARIGQMSADDLSTYIGKPAWLIDEYLTELRTAEVICQALRDKPKWEQLKMEFTSEEITIFEQSYKDYVDSLQDDILPFEEEQLYQAITFEIFAHRAKRNVRQVEEDRIRTEAELRDIINDGVHGDIMRREELTRRLDSFRAMTPTLNKELMEFTKQHRDIMKSLRTTREQRVKETFDPNTNILTLLKKIDEEDFLEKQKIEMELAKQAMIKKKQELSNYHTYADGEVFAPIFNAETAAKLEENK